MTKDPKPIKGFVSVGAGFSLMFLCGVAYSYGVAMPSIQESFDLSTAQAQLPFSAILVSYTLGMLIGGVFQDRIGATRACLTGALLFGAGFALAGLAPNMSVLLLTYGLMCGFGIGVSYIAATSAAVRWFPNRRGLAAGCVILGFGLGTLVMAPLKQELIAMQGWRTAFMIMGSVFVVAGGLLALLVRPPLEEVSGSDTHMPARFDFSTKQMVLTPSFVKVWIAWSLSLCAGLGWMGNLAAVSEKAGLSASAAALSLSAVALANGLSRPITGALADVIGRIPMLAGACALFTLASLFMLIPIEGGWRFFAMGIVFGACFGALLVNYSPLAVEFYGDRHLGSNFGMLFTSYGVGALVGPPLFGKLYDVTGSYDAGIVLFAVLTLIAVLLFASATSPQRSAIATT